MQALRVAAAGLVVIHHALANWMTWIIQKPDAVTWYNAAAGVDVFFVISGFVMAISAPALARARGGETARGRAQVFLWRRFTRIVPLYWAMTSFKLFQWLLNPEGAAGFGLTWQRIMASYFFIPMRNVKGAMFPAVEPGWTLNFEVFFYLLFAVALALDIAPLPFLAPVMVVVSAIRWTPHPSWPDWTSLASPLVLEFLMGVLLAQPAVLRRLPRGLGGVVLLLGGLAALLLVPGVRAEHRFIAWGLPAAAIVMGAVAMETEWGARVPGWLLLAGEASYSLYLSHVFVLAYFGDLVTRLHLPPGVSLALVLTAGPALCMVVALLVYRWVEQPMILFFKDRRTQQDRIIPVAEPVAAV